jgi:hypothetical protein
MVPDLLILSRLIFSVYMVETSSMVNRGPIIWTVSGIILTSLISKCAGKEPPQSG